MSFNDKLCFIKFAFVFSNHFRNTELLKHRDEFQNLKCIHEQCLHFTKKTYSVLAGSDAYMSQMGFFFLINDAATKKMLFC